VLEIINIKWWCHDVQHDEHHHDNFVDESNLYCLNISTGKLYLVGEYDDDVKNLRYFTVYGLNDFMNDEINLDGSFIIDDLTAKHLILAIKNKEERKPITIDKVLNLQHWVKPKFGDVSLIYEINSGRCNHPMDPEEWEISINCVGSLGNNFELKEIK